MGHAPPGYEEFAERSVRPLFARAYVLSRDWHLAEDLVQDTLARCFSQWSKVNGADNPDGYAQTILTRLYVSRMRRSSSREQPSEDLPEKIEAASHDADLRLTLANALQTLSPLERLVVVLRYVDDLPVKAVADMLQRSEAWVRTNAHRALAKLESHASLSDLDLVRL